MKYYSTKDKACARAFSLREAVQAGLAPDGGLFVPERIPQADMAVAERLAGESYAALAGYLAELFFGDDIDLGLLRREMERIYDFRCRSAGRSRYTLEEALASAAATSSGPPNCWASAAPPCIGCWSERGCKLAQYDPVFCFYRACPNPGDQAEHQHWPDLAQLCLSAGHHSRRSDPRRVVALFPVPCF